MDLGSIQYTLEKPQIRDIRMSVGMNQNGEQQLSFTVYELPHTNPQVQLQMILDIN